MPWNCSPIHSLVKENKQKRITPLHLVLVDKLEEVLGSSLGLLGVGLLLAELLLRVLCSIWVEAEKDLLVLERVLLQRDGALGDSATLNWSQNGLDLRAVDELAEVSLLDEGRREEEVLLEGGGLGGGAVDLLQGSKGSGGPDNEATEVATWGELEEVQAVDGAGLNTGQVAESKSEILAVLLGGVDDERTTSLAMAASSDLTLTGTGLLGKLDFLGICAGTDGLEELEGCGGLYDSTVGEGGARDDEGNLGDGGDTVTAGEEKRSAGGGGEGGSNSESLLTKVQLGMPLPPHLGRSEHATTSAHVTAVGMLSVFLFAVASAVYGGYSQSSLTSTVSTSTRDTGDTSDGTTGTPGLGRGLMASLLRDGIWLAAVLGHTSVNMVNNVRSDRSLEDGGEGERLAARLAFRRNDGDGWPGGHLALEN